MQLFPLLTINRAASGAIEPYRIVYPSADGVVAQAALDDDAHAGVSGQLGAADGERIDIEHAGVVPVEYGGTVAVGDLLSADASGRAVLAVTPARIIGVAQEAGELDEIGSVLIAPSLI